VGLVVGDPVRAQSIGLDTVGRAAPGQLVQPGPLVEAGGHHQLPPNAVRNPVLDGEFHQRRPTPRRQLGLRRAGPVVQPAVQHARVAAALVMGRFVLLLQHHDAAVRVPLARGPGHRQAHDAAPHHNHVGIDRFGAVDHRASLPAPTAPRT